MSDLRTAEEIRTIVGNKALYMLGAHNICGSKDSLMFKIKGSKTFKHIKITLNPKDLFDVTFTQIRANKITSQIVVNDLYVDMLHKTIEEKTGLYTKL